MSHVRMSHVSRMNESCPTEQDGVLAGMWAAHELNGHPDMPHTQDENTHLECHLRAANPVCGMSVSVCMYVCVCM